MADAPAGSAIGVFELAFDPEEGTERLNARRAAARKGKQSTLLSLLAGHIDSSCFHRIASPPIDAWMTSFPGAEDLALLDPAIFQHFVATGGCRAVAGMICDYLDGWSSDLVPGMVGVDHSCTGGVVEFLCRKHGTDRLGLLIFDAHLDVIPQWARAGLLAYAKTTAPHLAAQQTYADSMGGDPYHCGSFLGHLLRNGVVRPEHTVVLGAADAPPVHLRHSNDERARRFVEEYDRWIAAGMRVVSRDEIEANGITVEAMQGWLAGLREKQVYISFDADVACGPQVQAVRFRDLEGLRLRQIDRLWTELPAIFSVLEARPAGFDLVEIDPIAVRRLHKGRPDRTLEVAGRVLGGWADLMKAA